LKGGLSSGVNRRAAHWKSTDVSEENIASIFRAEIQVRERETNMKLV
jgi:hypothetical protein